MANNHPVYKLGKAPAQYDPRTLDWGQIVKPNVVVPAEYDFDTTHRAIPLPMFANDKYGCCVMSGRGHQTLRFEFLEQKVVIAITDKDITTEYFKETGNKDSGLVVIKSLTEWRDSGWKAAGKTYKIKSFAAVKTVQQGAPAATAHAQIQQAIYLDTGVGIGVSLPISAQAQINAGKPWDVVAGRTGRAGSWGGHYVLVTGYTKLGPVCVTWGQKQQMTWAFFDAYCDECYAIFDAVDTAKIKRHLKVAAIKAHLEELKAAKKADRRRPHRHPRKEAAKKAAAKKKATKKVAKKKR